MTVFYKLSSVFVHSDCVAFCVLRSSIVLPRQTTFCVMLLVLVCQPPSVFYVAWILCCCPPTACQCFAFQLYSNVILHSVSSLFPNILLRSAFCTLHILVLCALNSVPETPHVAAAYSVPSLAPHPSIWLRGVARDDFKLCSQAMGCALVQSTTFTLRMICNRHQA